MAITYLGGKIHKRAGATTTVSVSLTDIPAVGGGTVSLQNGDLIVVGYAIGAITDIDVAVTSGYTEQTDIYSNGTQYDTNLGVFTKFMSSSPDTTVTLGAMASANNSGVTAIRAYRGVDATTPLDVAIQTATGTGTGLPDPPSATPVTSGALAFVIGAQAASTMANMASSDLADFATDWQTDSQDVGIGVGHISWSGSGAIDPAVFTGGSSNSANSWAAATMVLRPAASSGNLAGSVSLSLAPTGAMNGRGSVAGAAIVSFAPTAALIGRGSVSASTALSIGTTGAISGRGILTGALALTLGPSGALAGRGTLTGAAAISVSPSASLTGRGAISGSASLSVTPIAALRGTGSVLGSASVAISPSGALTGVGTLFGATAIAIAPAGSLVGLGSLSGSLGITFLLTATTGGGSESISGSTGFGVTLSAVAQGYGALHGAAGFSCNLSGSLQPPSNYLTGGAAFGLTLSGSLANIPYTQIINTPTPPMAVANTPHVLPGGPIADVPVLPGHIVNAPVYPGQIL